MVREVKLSITRFWVQNLSLPDERSNHEISRRIGFYSVYLVSLKAYHYILLYLFTCAKIKIIILNLTDNNRRITNISSHVVVRWW